MKIGGWVQELWLDKPFGPKWPKYSFCAPGPKVTTFFEISWFYLKELRILDKMKLQGFIERN